MYSVGKMERHNLGLGLILAETETEKKDMVIENQINILKNCITYYDILGIGYYLIKVNGKISQYTYENIINIIMCQMFKGNYCSGPFIYDILSLEKNIYFEKYIENYKKINKNSKTVTPEYVEMNPTKCESPELTKKNDSPDLSVQILFMIVDYLDGKYLEMCSINLIKKLTDKIKPVTGLSEVVAEQFVKYYEYVIDYILFGYFKKALLTDEIIADTGELISNSQLKLRPHIYGRYIAWGRRKHVICGLYIN